MTIFATRLRRLAAVVVVGMLAALAATALAAPARQGTVSASAPVFAWDGGPGNGSGQGVSYVRCTPAVYECEDTLVEVKDAGDLLAEIKGGANANDLDVAIYKSDASGTVAGDPVNGDAPNVEDTSEGPNAKVTLKKATPGFYVVRERTFDGIQATWKGTVTLKPPVTAAPPAAAPTPSAPAATPTPAPKAKPSAKERRNACKKKAKKIKNSKKRKKALKRCSKIH